MKFRVWDNHRHTMEYINDLYWFEESGVHDFSGEGHYGDYIYMLHDGLFDKNEKEIYDGDILSNGNHINWIVFKEEGSFNVKHTNPMNTDKFNLSADMAKTRTVIGNIYENYELNDKW